MVKQSYDRFEIKQKIIEAIEKEHKNSEAYIAFNTGAAAAERKKIEDYVCSTLVALMYEF